MPRKTTPSDAFSISPRTRAIDTRVAAFARRGGVLAEGERCVVALSGGADSTALLLILSRVATTLGLDLSVAHFDHMLRTRAEAAAEATFVGELCGRLGVAFESGRQDVGARARRRRESIEEAARMARLAFLGRVARGVGASAVALGHTMDDRAETVLLNVLRGSGLDGLGAMKARAGWPPGRGPQIARPLLCLSRAETEEYCRESGVEPVQDPTNEMALWTRNRVRRELLPLMRTFNPRAVEALNRLGEAAEEDTDYLQEVADGEWSRQAAVGPNSVVLDRMALTLLPPAIGVRLVRRAYGEVRGAVAGLEAEHVDGVLDGARTGRRRTVPLPGGVVARCGDGAVRFERGQPGMPAKPSPAPLAVPGTADWGAWRITCDFANRLPERRDGGLLEAWIDASRVAPPLEVRSRRPGDRLRPVGLGGTRKLQDILVDAKVPLEERDGVPVVADAEGVVWVVGHCVDERAATGRGTEGILVLRARPVD